MFRKTNSECQLDLFASPEMILTPKVISAYNDKRGWHNLFYENVTSKINEDIFKVLFVDSNTGAPNEPIRILVAINILKEGLGVSDAELERMCTFDLLFRRALGLQNLNVELPSINTYYLFRRRLCIYEKETGINLMDDCMNEVTKGYLTKLNIQGKSVRMDSKLISSNIAWFGRYELIHKVFCKECPQYLSRLNPSLLAKVSAIMKRDAKEECYRLDCKTITERIAELGIVIQKVLQRVKASENTMLARVFKDHFILVKGKATTKSNHDISAQSLQSPYDEDATYRKKGDQVVKGYSINITETIDESKPSFITDVQVKPATAADNDYVQDAIDNTETLTGNKVSELYADGAYQSDSNRNYCDSKGIKFYTCGLQGKPSRYDYTMEEGEIHIRDKETGYTTIAIKTKKSFKFKTQEGKYRYFTMEAIEKCNLRKTIEATPPEKMKKRNNVEASMFQISFHTRNNKTRYRGLSKHKLYAYARAMWMNFRRLIEFEEKSINQRTLAKA